MTKPANKISVRRATVDDAMAITVFNLAIAEETEGKALDFDTVQRGVQRGLQRAPEATYFLAEDEQGLPVGTLMFTREWSDWRDGWLMWLHSVYVAPRHRGSGVFRLLLDHATATVQNDPDVVGLRLYVEADNQVAQAVYARTGFSDPRYKVLEKLFGHH